MDSSQARNQVTKSNMLLFPEEIHALESRQSLLHTSSVYEDAADSDQDHDVESVSSSPLSDQPRERHLGLWSTTLLM